MSQPESHETVVTETDVRELAFKRVKAKRDFSSHVVAYVVVNAFLVVIWLLGGGGYFWPAWVMAGWGIGVALNAWDVYGRRPISETDIDDEVRKVTR